MCVCVAYVQILFHTFADVMTISHQAEIQFLRGEFYDKGTLSEFTIISLWSYVCVYDLVCEHVGAELCACTNGAWVFVSVCVHEICLSAFVYMPARACSVFAVCVFVVSVVADSGGVVSKRIR